MLPFCIMHRRLRKTYWKRWKFRRIRRFLDTDAIKTLVHAVVTHGACGLLQWRSRRITDTLQHVLNAATRLVSCTLKYDRVLSTLLHNDLYWLDVPERIRFKLGVTVYRCLQNKAPAYLMDCCSRVADTVGRRHLLSASQHYLTVLRY